MIMKKATILTLCYCACVLLTHGQTKELYLLNLEQLSKADLLWANGFCKSYGWEHVSKSSDINFEYKDRFNSTAWENSLEMSLVMYYNDEFSNVLIFTTTQSKCNKLKIELGKSGYWNNSQNDQLINGVDTYSNGVTQIEISKTHQSEYILKIFDITGYLTKAKQMNEANEVKAANEAEAALAEEKEKRKKRIKDAAKAEANRNAATEKAKAKKKKEEERKAAEKKAAEEEAAEKKAAEKKALREAEKIDIIGSKYYYQDVRLSIGQLKDLVYEQDDQAVIKMWKSYKRTQIVGYAIGYAAIPMGLIAYVGLGNNSSEGELIYAGAFIIVNAFTAVNVAMRIMYKNKRTKAVEMYNDALDQGSQDDGYYY
jgi:flagellar biosynthesis GTPase FlhF